MILIMGSMQCPHCIDAIARMNQERIPYAFFGVHDSLDNLKTFMKIRETSPLYEEVRNSKGESLGIPLFRVKHEYVMDIEEAIKMYKQMYAE